MCFFKSPKLPAVQPPAQAPKAPEVQAIKRQNTQPTTGLGASTVSSLLTGGKGISDNQLLLGRNSLLGQ